MGIIRDKTNLKKNMNKKHRKTKYTNLNYGSRFQSKLINNRNVNTGATNLLVDLFLNSAEINGIRPRFYRQ